MLYKCKDIFTLIHKNKIKLIKTKKPQELPVAFSYFQRKG